MVAVDSSYPNEVIHVKNFFWVSPNHVLEVGKLLWGIAMGNMSNYGLGGGFWWWLVMPGVLWVVNEVAGAGGGARGGERSVWLLWSKFVY